MIRPIALLAALALAGGAPAQAQVFDTSAGPIEVDRVVDDLVYPWGVAFLPDGRMLITEREGQLLLADETGARTPVRGAPEVRAAGQGGLLDVAVDPQSDPAAPTIYLSFSEPEGFRSARTAVARAQLDLENATGPRLVALETIFRQQPATTGGRHFGSRIVIAPEGALFVTTGDRAERPRAQDPQSHIGKVVRIRPDGRAPADNPFVDSAEMLPEIWSLGHRNAQGAALRPADGALWTVEHGARGGDEINQPQAGLNYGWPVISYGRHYSGATIGDGVSAPGYEQPEYYWDPSIAPSGMAFVQGALFPEWEGDVLVGALRGQMLVRLDLSGDAIVDEERLFVDAFGRIRDVRVGPRGAIWFLTDDDPGGLYRMRPAKP